ncbi:MAG TPA: sulfocyanin-like copper-binding protein, partial [Gemmatimonadaceae bacterium]
MISLSFALSVASVIAASTASSDSTAINKYVSYDAGTKTVAITLISAATSTNGGLNFNGGSKGDQTITVPVSWTVRIAFRNHDIIPHSALVIRNQTPIPVTPSKPAFPHA